MNFEPINVVNKPWGREVWLELNGKYCLKKIEINKGHQTSLQYHEKKKETIYILSGCAMLVGVTEDKSKFEKKMKPGDCVTIFPLDVHRMIALDNLIFLESSTSEVDDVIRIEDCYGRE